MTSKDKETNPQTQNNKTKTRIHNIDEEHPRPDKFLCIPYRNYKTFREEIKELDHKIKETKADITKEKENRKFGGRCFVILKNCQEKEAMLDYYSILSFKRMCQYATSKITNRSIFKRDKRMYGDHFVTVSSAPEPSDVFWENAHVPLKAKIHSRIIIYLCLFILLGFSFAANLGIRAWKDSLEDEDDSQNTSRFVFAILSILSSLLIKIFNFLFEIIIIYLTKKERRSFGTKYQLSVTWKLVTAKFINTGILPLFYHFGSKNWLHSNGLANTVCYNMLVLILASPLISIFDPTLLWTCFKRKIEMRKGDNSKMSQRKANKLFEGPEVNMAEKYSDTILLLCMVLMYSFIVPIVPLIAICGFVLQYYADMYLLLWRHKKPNKLGENLAKSIFKAYPVFMLLYAFSINFFGGVLTGKANGFALSILLLALLNFLVPIKCILRMERFKRKYGRKNLSYKECREKRPNFQEDYDTLNPFIKTQAKKDLSNDLKKATSTHTEKVKRKHKLAKTLSQKKIDTNLKGKGPRTGGRPSLTDRNAAVLSEFSPRAAEKIKQIFNL